MLDFFKYMTRWSMIRNCWFYTSTIRRLIVYWSMYDRRHNLRQKWNTNNDGKWFAPCTMSVLLTSPHCFIIFCVCASKDKVLLRGLVQRSTKVCSFCCFNDNSISFATTPNTLSHSLELQPSGKKPRIIGVAFYRSPFQISKIVIG